MNLIYTSMRRKAYPPRWVRVTAAFCLVWLGLASVRSLVPGICETEREMSRARQSGASMAGLHPCCVKLPFGGPCPAGKGGKPAQAPGPINYSHCSLCTLVCTPNEPFAAPLFPIPALVAHAVLPQHRAQAPTPDERRAFDVRGPPPTPLA